MWTITKKEYIAFFSSFVGLGLLTLFFTSMGLYSWYFEGNIFDFGFAELSTFFELSPWFFMFFTPALCMKLFSEEYELKTFGLLKSLPISTHGIILGKLLGVLLVVLSSLLPTFLYVFSIGRLGSPRFNYDHSLILGGYLSILFITSTFLLLSTLASSLTSRQPLAFLLGVFFNFLIWQIPEEVKSLPNLEFLSLDVNSLKFHFLNMSKGVIDLKDISFLVGIDLVIYSMLYVQVKRK